MPDVDCLNFIRNECTHLPFDPYKSGNVNAKELYKENAECTCVTEGAFNAKPTAPWGDDV